MENTLASSNWNIYKKVSFRFFFIFFGLFIIVANYGAYPFWDLIFIYPTEFLHTLIPWVGKHLLHLSYDITVFTNGSGDTTYDYVFVFTVFVIAVLGTIIWSALDRRRTNYDTLYYWLTVAVRFYVGLMLIQYGLVKVIKLQFPDPNFYRLTQSYGDSSPMGLAWTFLGFSKGYNWFIGLAEISAALLLFRKTMTFGAIITLMTASNIMAVNYFFDVPVKILSTALFSMALFLLVKDGKRLFKFFFTGKAVSLPAINAPEINKKWLRITKWAFKSIVIGYALIYGFFEVSSMRKEFGDQAPKPKLYGLYYIDLFIKGNDTIPPLTTDSVRWNQLVIEWEGYARVLHMVDSISRFLTKIDTVSQKIDMTFQNDTTMKYSFEYEHPNPDKIYLNGSFQEDSISIFMTKKDINTFTLTSRGFHWISEYPFNR